MSDFVTEFGDWLAASVVVEPFEGNGFDGPRYGAAQTIEDVMIEDVRRLVRGPDGSERVSETTIYLPLTVDLDEHARVAVAGVQRVVARIARLDVFGLPGHVVVNLE